MTTRILFGDGNEVDSSDLTPGQRLMIEDGLPPAAIVPQAERADAWKGRRLRATKTFADVEPAKPTDPGTLKLLADRDAKARADAKAKRAADNEARIIKARQKAALKPAADAATQETTMAKTKTKKAPAKAAKKAAKAPAVKAAKPRAAARNARTPAAGKPDVVQLIAGMMARPDGASMEEMVKATGVEAHPMRAKIKLVRDRLGYSTVAPCKANGFRYHATAPKASD